MSLEIILLGSAVICLGVGLLAYMIAERKRRRIEADFQRQLRLDDVLRNIRPTPSPFLTGLSGRPVAYTPSQVRPVSQVAPWRSQPSLRDDYPSSVLPAALIGAGVGLAGAAVASSLYSGSSGSDSGSSYVDTGSWSSSGESGSSSGGFD